MEKWRLEKYNDIAFMYGTCNKEKLQKVKKCGCYYCERIYNTSKIRDWLEEEETALCPYCLIDSVIPESNEYELCEELLKYMHNYWF